MLFASSRIGYFSMTIEALHGYLEQLSLNTPHDKPVVGVSACLLGRPVRYDGEHKHEPLVTDQLAKQLTLTEFCPEVGIGMSVPRPPIQVMQIDNALRVVGVDAPHSDVTDALHQYAQGAPDNLDGFILKARSPSCGVGTTPIIDPRGDETGKTSGAFAHALRQRFPCAPMADESTLQSDAQIAQFLLQIYFYRHWRQAPSLTQVYDWRDTLLTLSNEAAFINILYSNVALTMFLECLAAHSE